MLHIKVVSIMHLLKARNIGMLTFLTAYIPKNTVNIFAAPILHPMFNFLKDSFIGGMFIPTFSNN